MSRSWRWSDANFCSLPSHTTVFGTVKPQTNVYSYAKVTDLDGLNKLLVASLSGKFIYVEYQRHFDNLIPTSKEIQFTYIPADAELISLDVISRSSQGKSLIVGVTFVKVRQGSQGEESDSTTFTQYLNLYSSSQPGEECFLESVAQEGVSIELSFIPYQLTHTELVLGDNRETVFLLSGNDQTIHMYRERFPQGFTEEPTLAVNEYFPEFTEITGCVHWMDIQHQDNFTRRLTVLGQQDGTVTLFVVDVQKREILRTWRNEHDSPVTRVKIMSLGEGIAPPSFLQSHKGFNRFQNTSVTEDSPTCDVLVLSALEPGVVYSDAFNQGFTRVSSLPDSEKYDVPLCVCTLDVDFDGQNEILIGTYGQELLAYKWCEGGVDEEESSQSSPRHVSSLNDEQFRNRHKSMECKRIVEHDETFISRKSKSQENVTTDADNTTSDEISGNTADQKKCDNKTLGSNYSNRQGYQLLWQRSFPCPVMGVDRVDIVGDGMDDLVVVTLNGVHIIQPDMGDLFEVCTERLQCIEKIINLEYEPEKEIVQDDDGTCTSNK